jgi:hypothetical protein
MQFMLLDLSAIIHVEFGELATLHPNRVAHMSPTCVALETILEGLPYPSLCENVWRDLRELDLGSMALGENIPFDNQGFLLEKAESDIIRIFEIRGKYYRGDPPEEVCFISLGELRSVLEQWLQFLEGSGPTQTSVRVLRGTVLHDPPLRWTVDTTGTGASFTVQNP